MGISQCGVVRFDNPSDPASGGWTSVAGEKPQRVNGPGALANDTLWWSNLDWTAMAAVGLNRTPYIKLTTYMTSWGTTGQLAGQGEVCADWGLLNRNLTEQDITQVLAAIFSRTMRFVSDHYGLDMSAAVPKQASLADELRVLMLPRKDERLTPEVDAALEAAHQPYNYCVMPRVDSEDYVHVQMVIPPVAHAHEVLGLVVPDSRFEFYGHTDLPSDPVARLDWIRAQSKPVLARVRVSDVDPDYAAVLAFGNGARQGCNRTWASHPEIMLLSKYATVDVDSAFVFGAYEQLPSKLRLPNFTGLQSMTPTADIVASNHLVGLGRQNPYSLEPAKSRAWSPRAIWINAVDRFICFTYALQLYRAGIGVVRYGAGRITTLAPKYHYRDAYDVATAIGLLAPPTIAPDIRIQTELQAYG